MELLLALVGIPLGAAALGAWRLHRRERARERVRVEAALETWSKAADGASTVVHDAYGRLRVTVTLHARPCEALVDPDFGGRVSASLRVGLPATALAELLKEDGRGGRVRTGDARFDDRFAVSARSEGAVRLLSDRVRAAMVHLPREMDAPKLVLDRESLELTWSGALSERLLAEGARVLLALRDELDTRLPLR